mgnify:CR=1 FL=1
MTNRCNKLTRILALITGALSLIMFITMAVALMVVDEPITKVLEIKGYALMLISLPLIGMGLLLAAYGGEI